MADYTYKKNKFFRVWINERDEIYFKQLKNEILKREGKFQGFFNLYVVRAIKIYLKLLKSQKINLNDFKDIKQSEKIYKKKNEYYFKNILKFRNKLINLRDLKAYDKIDEYEVEKWIYSLSKMLEK